MPGWVLKQENVFKMSDKFDKMTAYNSLTNDGNTVTTEGIPIPDTWSTEKYNYKIRNPGVSEIWMLS